MKASKKEESASTALATTVPANLALQLNDDVGQGFEEAGAEDYALPFLRLLQALSPQLKKTDASHIPEAEAGDIVNSVNGEMFAGSDGVRVVPVHYNKRYIEYRPRENGGGFIAVHDTAEDAKVNQQPGNEIVETANFYVLYEGLDGNWRPAVLSMTSSKLKVARRWMTMMSDVRIERDGGKVQAPIFAKTYRIEAVTDRNRRNEEYFNYKVTPEGWVSPTLYEDAKAFRQQVQQGARGVDAAAVVDVPDTGDRPGF